MGRLIKVEDIEQFSDILTIPNAAVTEPVLESVRQLDERRELEPMLREILWDPTETPHGPTEIADILTTKTLVGGEKMLAAFVVKGKHFTKVRPQDIDHQVIRLRQLPGLGLIALVAVGHIQDAAKRDFVQMALDADCNYLIVDAVDCARLLLAYEKICPKDGTPFDQNGSCLYGHKLDAGIELVVPVRGNLQYEIPEIRDVSHGGARRLTAKILVNPNYGRDVLRRIVREATDKVRISTYYRNDKVRNRWHDTEAHVVWLYFACDLQDLRTSNWLLRTQWIDPALDPTMRPLEMSASEKVDSISVSWNESYASMRRFYSDHTVEKGEALARLDPLVDTAQGLGTRISQWFVSFEKGDIDEPSLAQNIHSVSKHIASITDESMNLPFPPEDIKDYDTIAQSMFGHLDNMRLYYSEQGIETWPTENRTVLMRLTTKDFFEDLERLQFERKKLHRG